MDGRSRNGGGVRGEAQVDIPVSALPELRIGLEADPVVARPGPPEPLGLDHDPGPVMENAEQGREPEVRIVVAAVAPLLVPSGEPDLRPPGEDGSGPGEGPGEIPVQGLELDGPGQVAPRPAVVPLPEQDGPDAKEGPGVVGVEIEGPAAIDERGVVIALAKRPGRPDRPGRRPSAAGARGPAGRSARRRRGPRASTEDGP